MSRETGNVVPVPIKVLGLPESFCFTSIQDFLAVLQNNLVAAVPTDITNVHVSAIQPKAGERGDVWFRLNAGGKFLGIFMFDGVSWSQVLPAPQEIFKLYGNSDTPPKGFAPISASTPGITSGVKTALIAENLPAGAGPYEVYWATFIGF